MIHIIVDHASFEKKQIQAIKNATVVKKYIIGSFILLLLKRIRQYPVFYQLLF